MIKVSRYLKFSVLLAVAAVALAAWSLSNWQTVSAHEGEEASHAHTPGHTFEESSGQLILTVDASVLGEKFVLNDNEEIVWRYIGPSSTDELVDCHILVWLELEGKSREIKAKIESTSNGSVKASIGLTLPPDANDRTRYCFNVPIEEAGGTITPHILAYILQETSFVVDSTLIFSADAPSPLSNSDVPASISVTVPPGVEIDADSWQYARIDDDPDNCRTENQEIKFFSGSADNSTLDLQAEDAGVVFCFRVALAGTEEGNFIYKAYKVPAADNASVGDETEAGSISWIFIVAAVGVVGVIVFIVVKSIKSKQ